MKLSTAQLRVLRMIHEYAGVPSYVRGIGSRTLNTLVEKGLVRRGKHVGLYSHRLYLTDAGREYFAKEGGK